jgi:hypothetical protein
MMLGMLNVSLSIFFIDLHHTNAFPQVDEDDIRQDLKAVPTSVYDNVASIPELA